MSSPLIRAVLLTSLSMAVNWRRLPSRTTSTRTLSPLRFRPTVLRRSDAVLMRWPSTATMTSPTSMPAFSAAEPSTTSCTSAPSAVPSTP